MKKIMIGLVALSSISAFAAIEVKTASPNCPDISGEYSVCSTRNGTFANVINYFVRQKKENGITTFFLSGMEDNEVTQEKLISDGKIYGEDYVISGVEFDASTITTTSCTDTEVVTTSVTGLSGVSSDYEVTRKFKKDGNSLIIEVRGTLFGSPINDLTVCK